MKLDSLLKKIIKGKLENFTNQLKEFQQSMFQTLGIENVNFTFVSVIETYRDKFNSKSTTNLLYPLILIAAMFPERQLRKIK